MLKYIFPIMLLASPAIAASPETTMQALINMSSASYLCDMKIPEKVAIEFLKDISNYTGYSIEEVANVVDKKAQEFGDSSSQSQIRSFCATMGERYAKAGLNLR